MKAGQPVQELQAQFPHIERALVSLQDGNMAGRGVAASDAEGSADGTLVTDMEAEERSEPARPAAGQAPWTRYDRAS